MFLRLVAPKRLEIQVYFALNTNMKPYIDILMRPLHLTLGDIEGKISRSPHFHKHVTHKLLKIELRFVLNTNMKPYKEILMRPLHLTLGDIEVYISRSPHFHKPVTR